MYESENILLDAQRRQHTFDKFWIDDFLPSVLTLNVRSIGKVTRNEVPAFALNFDKTFKLLVLKKETIGFMNVLCFGIQKCTSYGSYFLIPNQNLI